MKATTPRQPMVIAHRGASALAPENTMPAFRLAAELGVDMIETDARLSHDGEIVLLHDGDLAHTTSCNGRVAELSAVALGSCDAGYWFAAPDGSHAYRGQGIGVPTLRTLLDLLDGIDPRVEVNVELKHDQGEPVDGLAHTLVTLLNERAANTRVLVSSFNWEAVDLVRSLDSTIRTAIIFAWPVTVEQALEYALSSGHVALHPHHVLLGSGSSARQAIERVEAVGLAVNVWTVNDVERAQELAEAGVDGIMTDDPGRLQDAFAK